MPAPSPGALLLVDVIQDFQFDGGERLLAHARRAAAPIAALADRARAAGVPVVYANDNVGDWSESFEALVTRCADSDSAGSEVVQQVRPAPGDLHVLKPKHSAFYQTSLEALLARLGTRTLVVAGFATDICVLATALDAAMRELALVVPQDACAAETERAHRAALVHLRRVHHAATPPASAVDVAALRAEAAGPPAGDGA